jgi:hypothetical protein
VVERPRGRGERRAALAGREVGGDRLGAGEPLDRGDVGRDDRRAALEQELRGRAADPARGAGDRGPPAGECLRDVHSPGS